MAGRPERSWSWDGCKGIDFCRRAGVKHRIQNLAFDALLSICEVIDKALDLDKATLLEALEPNDWVQKTAARDLRLSDRQMRYRVRKFELGAVIAQGKAHGLQRD